MIDAFNQFIKKEKLIPRGKTILLAVSGGLDSVVMAHLFHRAGIKFAIAHTNFKLRLEESDADANFVMQLAEMYSVPFHQVGFNTTAHARKRKISIQMAARELRYTWFEELLDAHPYHALATAHHLDDQAETFFINLLRGTGISGLHGILPKHGRIIRPLLFATRDMIGAYARTNGLTWREDSSNQSRKYVRNKLRLDVMPVLAQINPRFAEKLDEGIRHLRDAEKVYFQHMTGVSADLIEKTEGSVKISIDWVYEYEPHGTYLFELLKPYDFTFSVVQDIVLSLDSIPGKIFYSATHRLLRDREHLIIQPLSQILPPTAPGFEIVSGISRISAPIELELMEQDAKADLPYGKKHIACLDISKLQFPLLLRRWKRGDTFVPFGLKGHKKLSDFFIDQKLSRADKEKAWLLTSGPDIVWIVGYRIDNRYRIRPGTQKALIITAPAYEVKEDPKKPGTCCLF